MSEKAKKWYEKKKKEGFKFEVKPHWARNDCWKKEINKKKYYFSAPINAAGYQIAVDQMLLKKAQLNTKRPNLEVWNLHLDIFQQFQKWFLDFGVPAGEKQLQKDVDGFINWIEVELAKPVLPEVLPVINIDQPRKNDGNKKTKRTPALPFLQIYKEVFIPTFGTLNLKIDDKWNERLRQLKSRKRKTKKSQLIGHWIDAYLEFMKFNAETGAIEITTYGGRKTKLNNFKEWIKNEIGLDSHIQEIDSSICDGYHKHCIKNKRWSYSTAKKQFNAMKFFLNWLDSSDDCEFSKPKKLKQKAAYIFPEDETTFVDVESILWTPEDFKKVLEHCDDHLKCFIVLMLNTGYRSTDLEHLKQHEVDLKNKRLCKKRHKTMKHNNSPVVNYLLWDKTCEMIEKIRIKTKDPNAPLLQTIRGSRFVNSYIKKNGDTGYYDNLSILWSRKDKNLKIMKSLSKIRSTGSTFLNENYFGLDRFYQGKRLSEDADVYNLNYKSGKPQEPFDQAIIALGANFGLCKAPKKEIKLTARQQKLLEKSGKTLDDLLNAL